MFIKLLSWLAGLLAASTHLALQSKSTTLSCSEPSMRFEDANATTPWWIVNDSVMGGVSSSRIGFDGNALRFTGKVSLQNNGGFASMRRSVEGIDMQACNLVSIRVKGDGQRYQLRFRTNDRWRRAAYQVSFQTQADTWQTFQFHQKDFFASFRGWRVSDAPPLQLARVAEVGFLIADKQSGEFTLKLSQIEFFQAGPKQ